jgi:hypothetical protein
MQYSEEILLSAGRSASPLKKQMDSFGGRLNLGHLVPPGADKELRGGSPPTFPLGKVKDRWS